MRRVCTRTASAIACFILASSGSSYAGSPNQAALTTYLNRFEIVGNSYVTAQQAFLGTPDKVYIIDRAENNPQKINGHPAWASEWSTSSQKTRIMNMVTNTFCAGGNVLGNGTWINVGGNQPVTYGGATAQNLSSAPYFDADGGRSIRLLNPSDDGKSEWVMDTPMTTRRWYPFVETLEDGSVIILGGCQYGGFIDDSGQTNPTYEIFPSRGPPIELNILVSSLPINLYPLTWLLPSGNIFIQSNWETSILDYKNHKEYPLDNVPDAVRTYPGCAANAMLPLTPANNWTATIMFCGGSNVRTDQWSQNWDLPHWPASFSCVQITPDISTKYVEVDPLPEGRTMGSLILLPDGRILCLNGARTGAAGYGNTTYSIGQSYADAPNFTPVIYDPKAPAGKRWSREGLFPSTIARMYHSSATLLPDGSVFVAGSNPNSDYNATATYPTEYLIERFYPSYYNERRPTPQGLPAQLAYGGSYFNITLSSSDLFSNINNTQKTSVVVIRTGFSTHSMNMGMRMIQLENTYTGYADGSAILHVSQLPPNPAVLAPGPAYIFVVVNGVPSVGVPIMVGSGNIETQKTIPSAQLPSSSVTAQRRQLGQGQKSSGTPVYHQRRSFAGWLALVGMIASIFLFSP